MSLRELGRLAGYSRAHLSAVERGETVPSEHLLDAVERALATRGHLIPLLPAVLVEQGRARHEREAARRGVHAQPRPPDGLDWERLAFTSRQPGAVTSAIVEDLEVITDRHRWLYHVLPTSQMVGPAEAHLSLLLGLLESDRTGRLRHRLASAASETAGLVAWLWFDAGHPERTRRHYCLADDALRESGDEALSAYIGGFRAITDMADRGPDAALRRLSRALSRAPKALHPVTAAWLEALTARALARSGERPHALGALARAEAALESTHGDDRPAWMYDFDDARLAAQRGSCWLALGHHREAAVALQDAATRLPATCERRRAELHVELAWARLGMGEVQEAGRLASDSLRVFAGRGSMAGLRRVERFRTTLASMGEIAAARALENQARALAAQTS